MVYCVVSYAMEPADEVNITIIIIIIIFYWIFGFVFAIYIILSEFLHPKLRLFTI